MLSFLYKFSNFADQLDIQKNGNFCITCGISKYIERPIQSLLATTVVQIRPIISLGLFALELKIIRRPENWGPDMGCISGRAPGQGRWSYWSLSSDRR